MRKLLIIFVFLIFSMATMPIYADSYWNQFKKTKENAFSKNNFEISTLLTGYIPVGSLNKIIDFGAGFDLGFHFNTHHFLYGLNLGLSASPFFSIKTLPSGIERKIEILIEVPVAFFFGYSFVINNRFSIVPYGEIGVSTAIMIYRDSGIFGFPSDNNYENYPEQKTYNVHQLMELGLNFRISFTDLISLQFGGAYRSVVEYGFSGPLFFHKIKFDIGILWKI